MDEEEFWALIATLGGLATADRVTQLEQFLADLPPDGITGFADRLAEALAALDTYEHYQQPIASHLGDDGFLYLRCDVVALGRNRHAAIVAEPTLLNRVEVELGEPLLYAAATAWEASTELPWLHQSPISYETGSSKAHWPADCGRPAPAGDDDRAAGTGEANPSDVGDSAGQTDHAGQSGRAAERQPEGTIADAVWDATGKALSGLFQGFFGAKRRITGQLNDSEADAGGVMEPNEPVTISWGGNVVPLLRNQERPEFYEGAAAGPLNDLVKRIGLPPGLTSICLILQLGNRWHWSHENSISVDGIPQLDIWIESPWQELLAWPEEIFADFHAATCAHVIHEVLSERDKLTAALAAELRDLAASYPSPGLTNPDS
ncbi:DUF4240 domain-containing protein [Kribbella deserti]|uniref:DUF4240 domain-containing protein n=1 Tax=Kribbella deserti TaxID=1926257 RepID=A0ABV6QJU3_9ACTN